MSVSMWKVGMFFLRGGNGEHRIVCSALKRHFKENLLHSGDKSQVKSFFSYIQKILLSKQTAVSSHLCVLSVRVCLRKSFEIYQYVLYKTYHLPAYS